MTMYRVTVHRHSNPDVDVMVEAGSFAVDHTGSNIDCDPVLKFFSSDGSLVASFSRWAFVVAMDAAQTRTAEEIIETLKTNKGFLPHRQPLRTLDQVKDEIAGETA